MVMHTHRTPNIRICREAGEPAPTAHDSELGVLCAAHDRSAQRLTRTESAGRIRPAPERPGNPMTVGDECAILMADSGPTLGRYAQPGNPGCRAVPVMLHPRTATVQGGVRFWKQNGSSGTLSSAVRGGHCAQPDFSDVQECRATAALPGCVLSSHRGGQGFKSPQLHPGQGPVPITGPAFLDLGAAAKCSSDQVSQSLSLRSASRVASDGASV